MMARGTASGRNFVNRNYEMRAVPLAAVALRSQCPFAWSIASAGRTHGGSLVDVITRLSARVGGSCLWCACKGILVRAKVTPHGVTTNQTLTAGQNGQSRQMVR